MVDLTEMHYYFVAWYSALLMAVEHVVWYCFRQSGWLS